MSSTGVDRTAMSETRQPGRSAAGQTQGMELDFERCYRAVDSRDQRFDGWFYTAVKTTGIYCRPSCPAITPKRANVTFYQTAAAPHGDGFRARLRRRGTGRVSGPAGSAVPTRRGARPTGTPAPTWWAARCASSATASWTA